MRISPLLSRLPLASSIPEVSRLLVSHGTTYYPLLIGFDLLAQTGHHLVTVLGRRHCIVVTDDHVSELYLETVLHSLKTAEHKLSPPIIVASGEQAKNFPTLMTIIDALLERHIDRRTVVIALGGGVVGDVAGFAAAITLRGLDLVHIPTTLIAQVDSAIGGKTGINTPHAKNLVGAFHQPRLVIASIHTLLTLSERHRRAGYAEILKYALITDAPFFDWLEKHGKQVIDADPVALSHAIVTSCQTKIHIVTEDEQEKAQRALLNLGHTFGHALETVLGYADTFSHGEAVAVGLVFALRLSQRLGLVSEEEVTRVSCHIKDVGLPIAISLDTAQKRTILACMQHDKKVIDGRLTFILLRGIGQAFIAHDVDAQIVTQLVNCFDSD